jgi:hypothetical protein
MQFCLDVVDLLQLREVWCKRPIVTAFTRLEPRPKRRESGVDFRIDSLMPRLMRLKMSSAWRTHNPLPTADPSRSPLSNLSDECLSELYPDAHEIPALRQHLFMGAYTRFVIADFRADPAQMRAFFKALAAVRSLDAQDHISGIGLPIEGAPEWIPAEITDEIRSLDTRYRLSEPGAPAAYVVAEPFWTMVVKAEPHHIDVAIERCVPQANASDFRQNYALLSEVAQAWSRSPSVVGLCYQMD